MFALVLGPSRTSVFFRHDTDERQPESRPSRIGSAMHATRESQKKRPPALRLNSRSVVDYGHDSIRAGMFAEQLDAGTGSGEFDRIAEQVDDRTRQKLAIATDHAGLFEHCR